MPIAPEQTPHVFTSGATNLSSEDSYKRKVTVFRQYTSNGESIRDAEETPEKMKIDELMGRLVTTQTPSESLSVVQEGPTGTATEKKNLLQIVNREHVQKTSSVGHIVAGSGYVGREKILVSNAHSKNLTESIVSVKSSPRKVNESTADYLPLRQLRPQLP